MSPNGPAAPNLRLAHNPLLVVRKIAGVYDSPTLLSMVMVFPKCSGTLPAPVARKATGVALVFIGIYILLENTVGV